MDFNLRRRNVIATPLSDATGVPSNPLIAILEATGIYNKDWEGIVKATQEQWRKPTLQAAQIAEEHAHLHDALKPHFEALQMIGVQPVPLKLYDCALFGGATYLAMHKRIRHAVDKCRMEQNVDWVNTVFLASKRDRFRADKESDDAITKMAQGGFAFNPSWARPKVLPEDKAGIAKLVQAQVGHRFLWEEFRQYNVVAPNKADGKPAGFKETLEAFLAQTSLNGDSLLLILSQPHMLRQLIQAIKVLGNRFKTIHVTGYDTPATLNITQALDELAKLIFEVTQE